MILYELTRGLAYRDIEHAEMHWYKHTLPIGLAFLIVAAFVCLPVAPKILGPDGVLASSLSVVSTLPGFYFAGLAAVATFSGLNMDRVMPSPAPKLKVKVGGASQVIDLSRRQFLSYLFSYLVLISFSLCIFIVALNGAAPTLTLLKAKVVEISHGVQIWYFLKVAVVSVYAALVAIIVVATLHGMYFLSEKIHQP